MLTSSRTGRTPWRVGIGALGRRLGPRGSVVLAGILLAAPVLAQSPAPLQGVVADADTRSLIPEATVMVESEGIEARSGPDGGFSFPAAPLGRLSVRVQAPGYGAVVQEVEVRAGRVAFLQVLLSRSTAESSLRLRVTDQRTARPISGAQVRFPDLDLLTLADANGEAFLSGIPAGAHLLQVTMLGYAAAEAVVDFEPGSAGEGEVQLGVEPIELDGIDVSVRERWSATLERNGFYRRASAGLGRYLDRTAIDDFNPVVASDVFRRIPGVRLVSVGMVEGGLADGLVGLARYGLVGRRGVSLSASRPCFMHIYLDGILWSTDGDIDQLPIEWIEGLEVYNGVSQIPAQYNRPDVVCGVVLVWTTR